MSKLFTPIKIGSIEIKNRIIMSPLTRARAVNDRVPNDLMATYYAQRSSAGLIISEATSVTPMGVGYADTPGIWSKSQVEGWKKITKAVHEKGGKIVMQLWHVGRISHSSFLGGELPVAPSAIKPAGKVSLLRPSTEYEKPRALELEEIKEVIEAFRTGAKNALDAGFDGVEIHAANGYLLDQFLQDSTNKREDIYGGSVKNRVRLLLEVTDAVIDIWGKDRVGVHLSPRSDLYLERGDSNTLELFSYVVKELNSKKIAFIFTREYQAEDSISPKLKELFKGTFIVNEKFSKDSAEKAIESGLADAVSFGVPFIANPDLVERFKTNSKLNEPTPETFYGKDEIGYTDYPVLSV